MGLCFWDWANGIKIKEISLWFGFSSILGWFLANWIDESYCFEFIDWEQFVMFVFF